MGNIENSGMGIIETCLNTKDHNFFIQGLLMSAFIEGIVVAKSRKYYGYCLVVFCLEKNKCFRIISKEDRGRDYALTEKECTTESNETILLLDVVKIPVESEIPQKDWYQKENLVLKPNEKMEIIGKCDVNDLITFYNSNELVNEEFILLNGNNILSVEEAQKSNFSFMLARVDELKFKIYNGNKCRCYFKYKGKQYSNFFVTIKEKRCFMMACFLIVH